MPSLQHALELHRSGKLTEAEQAYRAVLKQQPRQPDALSLLGVVLEALGRPHEAVPFIRKAVALDPKAALFRLHLGNALLASGNAAAAVPELRLAARLQPNLAEAHYNLGNALRAVADTTGAIAAYRACLALHPALPDASNNLALLISAEGDYDGAITLLNQVLAHDPAQHKARVNLANIAEEAGRYALAYAEARHVVAADSTCGDALFAWGLAATRLGLDTEALQAYTQLLALAPERATAWDNYAQLLQAHGRWHEADAAYARARTLAPDDAAIQYHCALFDLLMGRLPQGFAGYAWRFQAIKNLKRLVHATAPIWDGRDLAGKTILVSDEQGFGDSIMFCRYLPLLRQRGARVIYACRAPLRPLLQGWDGADAYIAPQDAPNTPCDAHAALLDLPHWLGTDTTTIPAHMPYLPVPAGDMPLSITSEKRLKVGIVWAGNRQHKHDQRRSIAFEIFSALFGVAQVQFYNLLRPNDLRGDEAMHFAAQSIIDLGGLITDFAATARCIAALDLVISVDTSLVHLAGALGKPVWVLLPMGPDWRWQTARSDSPWYPTAKLYRQTRPDDWADVLQQVQQDLTILAAATV
jgi:Flp pilus assembly protein TadD